MGGNAENKVYMGRNRKKSYVYQVAKHILFRAHLPEAIHQHLAQVLQCYLAYPNSFLIKTKYAYIEAF